MKQTNKLSISTKLQLRYNQRYLELTMSQFGTIFDIGENSILTKVIIYFSILVLMFGPNVNWMYGQSLVKTPDIKT